jgi:universal stress protein E
VKLPKSVLVILDKPKHAQTALEEALELHARTGAHLKLVSFVWHAIAEQKEVYDAAQRRAMRREIVRSREVWVRDLIRDREIAALPITLEVVWTSDIADWVASHCADMDLVIKSVHKSHTLVHTPLDWQLIRTCPKPLLIAGAPMRRRKKPGNDVLATLDLRNADRRHQTLNFRVLDAAARFAEMRKGKLHCVAVVEYSEVLKDLEIVDPRKVRQAAIESSQEFLDALLEPYDIAKNRVHRPAGKVGQMVAATVRKANAGLVVVGSAARRGLEARVLGNSAEKILERSPVDVLIIHP